VNKPGANGRVSYNTFTHSRLYCRKSRSWIKSTFRCHLSRPTADVCRRVAGKLFHTHAWLSCDAKEHVPKGLFTAHELNWTGLQQVGPLHDALIGHARVSVTTWLAAAKLGRLVLSQFVCRERTLTPPRCRPIYSAFYYTVVVVVVVTAIVQSIVVKNSSTVSDTLVHVRCRWRHQLLLLLLLVVTVDEWRHYLAQNTSSAASDSNCCSNDKTRVMPYITHLWITTMTTSCYSNGSDRPHHRRRADQSVVLQVAPMCTPI